MQGALTKKSDEKNLLRRAAVATPGEIIERKKHTQEENKFLLAQPITVNHPKKQKETMSTCQLGSVKEELEQLCEELEETP